MKRILTSELLLKTGQKSRQWPWPETWIFIEMHSAYRNQGNGDETEKCVQIFSLFCGTVVEECTIIVTPFLFNNKGRINQLRSWKLNKKKKGNNRLSVCKLITVRYNQNSMASNIT